MSDSILAQEAVFQFPWSRAGERDTFEQAQHAALIAELRAARAREEAWLREKSKFAIPLGFIVNELITNSAKYARNNITVRLETTATIGHSLSVLDDGPGLPAGFDPARSKGLGMKIISSLVKQIGGKLQIVLGANGHGAGFAVTFCSPSLATNGT
jgi:two-component sensor histidine kinase